MIIDNGDNIVKTHESNFEIFQKGHPAVEVMLD